MATAFKKGDAVKLKAEVPQGTVDALRMLEDGTVQCLLVWTNAAGEAHNRWFDEDQLIAV